MKKLSVNGKTFDEVFAERGKSVDASKMDGGKVYFLDQTEVYGIMWVIELDRMSKPLNRLHDICCVDNHGYYIFDGTRSSRYCGHAFDCDGIYIATPNQINLLNLYKSKAK